MKSLSRFFTYGVLITALAGLTYAQNTDPNAPVTTPNSNAVSPSGAASPNGIVPNGTPPADPTTGRSSTTPWNDDRGREHNFGWLGLLGLAGLSGLFRKDRRDRDVHTDDIRMRT